MAGASPGPAGTHSVRFATSRHWRQFTALVESTGNLGADGECLPHQGLHRLASWREIPNIPKNEHAPQHATEPVENRAAKECAGSHRLQPSPHSGSRLLACKAQVALADQH